MTYPHSILEGPFKIVVYGRHDDSPLAKLGLLCDDTAKHFKNFVYDMFSEDVVKCIHKNIPAPLWQIKSESYSQHKADLFIYFTASAKTVPVKFPGQVRVGVNAADQSLIAPTIQSELTAAGFRTFSFMSDSAQDLHMLRNGCVPLSINIGMFHSDQDKAVLRRNSYGIARACANAVRRYLQPFAFSPNHQPQIGGVAL